MEKIREKLRRRASHKDKDFDFDNDSADEETQGYLNKEVEEHEKDDKFPEGRPGSFLNRMISHGNKKTEDEIAAAHHATTTAPASTQAAAAGSTTTTTTA